MSDLTDSAAPSSTRRGLLERDGLFWAALLGLTALNISPIWMTDLVAAADLPAHLGKVAMMQHIGDPTHYLARFYAFGDLPAPNLFYAVVCRALSGVFGLLVANQLAVSLYFVLFPLCVLVFLRAFGRSRWLVFVALLFAWNRYVPYGFVDYTFSVPFLLLGLGLARRFADGPSAPRFAAAAAGGLLLYATHLQSFVVFCFLATALYVLAVRWRRPADVGPAEHTRGEIVRLALRGATLVPSVALVIPWIVRHGTRDAAPVAPEIRDAVQPFGSLDNLGAVYDPLTVRLSEVYQHTLHITRCDTGAALFVGFVGLVLLGLLGRRHPRTDRGWLHDHALELLTLAAAAFYLLLPTHIAGLAVIHHRLALVACLLLVGWAGARPFGGLLTRQLVLVVPAVVLCAWRVHDVRHHTAVFERQIEGLLPTLAAAQPNTRLVRMIGAAEKRGQSSFDFALFRHVHAYHVVLNGGAIGDSFAKTPGRIVVLGAEPVGKAFGPSPGWAGQPEIAEGYHYALTRRADAAQITADGLWIQAARHGDWALYQSTRRGLDTP